MSDQPSPGLWSSVKVLVFFGWGVAGLRLLLDGIAGSTGSEELCKVAWVVGVYWLIPPLMVWHGISRGPLCDLNWPRLAQAVLIMVLLVWALPNFIAYGTAQFAGWEHGRFFPGTPTEVQVDPDDPTKGFETVYKDGRAPAMGETTGKKIMNAAAVGGLSSIVGLGWSLLWATATIWFPAQARRKRRSRSS